MGLLAICLTGIVMMSIRPLLMERGYVFAESKLSKQGSVFSFDSGHAEGFGRPQKRRDSLSKSVSLSTLEIAEDGNDASESSADDKGDRAKPCASLGAHISMISLSVFMSFGLSLSSRVAEIELGLSGRALSGVPLFKLAMFCGLFSLHMTGETIITLINVHGCA